MKHRAWTLTLLLGLAGCGSSTTATVIPTSQSAPKAPAPVSAQIGQGIELQDDHGMRATVTLNSIRYRTRPDSTLGQRPAHGTFAVANISIQDQAGRYDFNSLYFKYQAPDGTTFSPLDGNAAMAGFDPSLSAGTIGPGQAERGLVTFDVPAPGGDIQLTGPLGDVAGQWQLTRPS